MSKFEVAYVPVGLPTFHLECADTEFKNSVAMLKTLDKDVVYPNATIMSLADLSSYLDTLTPDLIILQNTTFANAAYASEVLNRFSCPILLWTLPEPVIDGTRLRLNSLTGAYSAANAIRTYRKAPFEYILGGTNEAEVIQKIDSFIKAGKLKKNLRSLRIASIGHTPEGFGFGRATDIDLLSVFGVSLNSVETREMMNRAMSYSKDDIAAETAHAESLLLNLSDIDSENVENFIRLYKAYNDYVTENNIGAIASRCWPDYFNDYGTPVCAVLALLNDRQIAASCEADTYGTLSMYMGIQLSGNSVFFGDPVSLNADENTITYWHCGTAACSLARKEDGACVGIHCNRRLGPTLEFGCKPCDKVTVFRVGKDEHGKHRFFIMGGEALDKPKQFNGTSIVVRCDGNAKDIINRSVSAGWEPHFVVIYGDVRSELCALANMLDIEVECY